MFNDFNCDRTVQIEMPSDKYTVGEVFDQFECGDKRLFWHTTGRTCGKIKWKTPGMNSARQWKIVCPKCGGYAFVTFPENVKFVSRKGQK